MIFIKLTLQDGREIHVNAERISEIIKQKNDEKVGSIVYTNDQNGVFVNETPEEIIKQISEVEESSNTSIELIQGFNIDDFDFSIRKDGGLKKESSGNFEEKLSYLINSTCKNNSIHTHDFILAKFLCDCIESFKDAEHSIENLKKS